MDFMFERLEQKVVLSVLSHEFFEWSILQDNSTLHPAGQRDF